MENYEHNNVTFSLLFSEVPEIVTSCKQNPCFLKKFIHPHLSHLQNKKSANAPSASSVSTLYNWTVAE